MTHRFPEARHLNFIDMEQSILEFWAQEKIFERLQQQKRQAPAFTFYEGPPTANGRPGIHHVLGRTIKDIFCRYRSMCGYFVERKAGWDTHGLPVEIEVEKTLGLASRRQIEEYGIAAYNQACRESVLRYKSLWDDLTVRMGYWVDLEHPYITFTNDYIETVWWLIKQLHIKGLLYRGYRIQWYSPASETVLSSHEVSLGYRETKDPSIYVRFPIAGEQNAFFLAWTTTPWTLPANVALAVNPAMRYARVKLDDNGEELILALERLNCLTEPYQIIATMSGAELVGMRYRPVFDDYAEVIQDHGWRVVMADYVRADDGTGMVHTAPAFGADDYDTAIREQIPLINPVSPEGYFNQDVGLLTGSWFKDADSRVIQFLKNQGLLYRKETITHSYPFDWRRNTPLMSYPVSSWFISTSSLKNQLVELNETVNWHPPHIGTGRFGDWLKNNVDWALSRQRYWGTPLPIWVSDAPDSQEMVVIGSLDELRHHAGEAVEAMNPLDLHRPYVDDLTWPAADGGTMRRVEDVLDVWFDSGAMPFAQWHYPFENQQRFKQHFPADFICEGLDQTRGWFYTLHAISVLVMGQPAYRNVVVNGLVLDENGEKMSKSRGNTVDPFEALNEHGADVMRWYMISSAPPWENVRYARNAIEDTRRKLFSTLHNVYHFFATYANIDRFDPSETPVPLEQRPELDRWILSRLYSTVAMANEHLERYDVTAVARAIEMLVDDLSNWYIRRSRPWFWAAKKEDSASLDLKDKLAVYQTSHECLLKIATLMAPIAPFYSEWLYRALLETNPAIRPVSIHMTPYPGINHAAIDTDLERSMVLARQVVTTALALRNRADINVRQPLRRILIATSPRVSHADIMRMQSIIVDEINVERIEMVQDVRKLVRYKAKPDYRKLGPRLGKTMKAMANLVAQWSQERIEQLISEGQMSLDLDGKPLTIALDELIIEHEGTSGWLIEHQSGITVALDTEIDAQMHAKGLAREIINRIQNLRKQADFEVTDRMHIACFTDSPLLRSVFQEHGAWIAHETLAIDITSSGEVDGEITAEYQLDAHLIRIGLKRIHH